MDDPEFDTTPKNSSGNSNLFQSVSRFIAHERTLSNGERASLRRADAAQVICEPAFFRVVGRFGIDVFPRDALLWGTIIQAIALTAPFGCTVAAGEALATAKISEGRFVKLMAARGDTLLSQIGMTARRLASAQSPIDWTDLAKMILAEGRSYEEQAAEYRFLIARSFYRKTYSEDARANA